MRTRSTARGGAPSPKPEGDVEVIAASPAPKRSVPVKRRRKSKWDSSTVLTSEKSPLAQCDLRAILQHPLAWDVLTPDERQFILGRFPDNTHVLDAGTSAAKPDLGALLNDNNFRHDCARYAEGISNGWHEEGWLWDAWEAHSRRKAGEFDGVLERELAEEWGVKLGEVSEGGTGKNGDAGGSKGVK